MYEFTYYRVGDVMTSDPISINKDARISDVERIFEEHDFNGIPIVDNKDHLVAMITKLDVLKAFSFRKDSKIPKYKDIMSQKISSLVTKDPYSVHLETPCTRVLNDLVKKRIKSIPVVEGGCLVGIIAREDILHALRLASQGILPERIASSNPLASAGVEKKYTQMFRNFSAW